MAASISACKSAAVKELSHSAPACMYRKYSTFPAGPGSGEGATASMLKPSSRAQVATLVMAWACRRTSRTTPPCPISSLPTSNWGLTISRKSAAASATATSAGNTRVREIKDRSETTRVGAGVISPAARVRTLVRSMTFTRGSLCSDQASCP